MYTTHLVELVTPTKVTTLTHLSTLKDTNGYHIAQGNTEDMQRIRDALNEKDALIEELKRRLKKYND